MALIPAFLVVPLELPHGLPWNLNERSPKNVRWKNVEMGNGKIGNGKRKN
jgi:hypothetical protein